MITCRNLDFEVKLEILVYGHKSFFIVSTVKILGVTSVSELSFAEHLKHKSISVIKFRFGCSLKFSSIDLLHKTGERTFYKTFVRPLLKSDE